MHTTQNGLPDRRYGPQKPLSDLPPAQPSQEVPGAPIPGMASLEEIIDAVCLRYGINRDTLLHRSPGWRCDRLAAARAVAAALARKLTYMSLPEIAAALGWKSHSTAHAAMRRIESTMSREIDRMVQQLQPNQETA